MKYLVLIFCFVVVCKGSNPTGRIIDSIPSAPDDGYAVTVYSALRNHPFSDDSFLSTGVAISREYVIATGQAIYGFEAWRVGINSNNRNTQDITEVVEYFIHEDFDPETLEFNIGVLKVSNTITRFLPVAQAEPDFPIQFAIGFGFSSDNGDQTLPEVSQQSAIQRTFITNCRLEFNQRVVRDFNFCGSGVARFASGDQGGPVVDFLRTRVYGIISYWNSFSQDHNPVVFTSLTDPEIQTFLAPFL